MENLLIKRTNRTPEVDFGINGNLRISGRSIPEDAGLFYTHLYSWVFTYCMNPLAETIINLELEYMNSGTAKCILQLLRELSTITANKNNKLVINWYYESGDEDMLEKGEYYQHILKHEFVFIEME